MKITATDHLGSKFPYEQSELVRFFSSFRPPKSLVGRIGAASTGDERTQNCRGLKEGSQKCIECDAGSREMCIGQMSDHSQTL